MHVHLSCTHGHSSGLTSAVLIGNVVSLVLFSFPHSYLKILASPTAFSWMQPWVIEPGQEPLLQHCLPESAPCVVHLRLYPVLWDVSRCIESCAGSSQVSELCLWLFPVILPLCYLLILPRIYFLIYPGERALHTTGEKQFLLEITWKCHCQFISSRSIWKLLQSCFALYWF